MVQELNRIFGIEFSINPVQLLLGLPDSRLTKSSHKRLFNLLTFTARKNLLLSWISEKPPTKANWHTLVMQFMPLEYLTCSLRCTTETFYKRWDLYLKLVGPQMANTLTKGYLSRREAIDLEE